MIKGEVWAASAFERVSRDGLEIDGKSLMRIRVSNSPLCGHRIFPIYLKAVPHTQLAQLRIILSGPTVVCEELLFTDAFIRALTRG